MAEKLNNQRDENKYEKALSLYKYPTKKCVTQSARLSQRKFMKTTTLR